MAINMILMTGGLACAQSSDFLLPLKHFVVHILHPPTALYQTYVNQFVLARICFLLLPSRKCKITLSYQILSSIQHQHHAAEAQKRSRTPSQKERQKALYQAPAFSSNRSSRCSDARRNNHHPTVGSSPARVRTNEVRL